MSIAEKIIRNYQNPVKLSEDDIFRFERNLAVGKPPDQTNPHYLGLGPCVIWKASKCAKGYGQIRAGGVNVHAHRVAWVKAKGPIPKGMLVCHKCDNPECCNPDHLFLGTDACNNRDKVRKGRCNAAKGDRHGSHTRPERRATGDRHGSRTKPEQVPRGDRSGARKHPERMPRGSASGNASLDERQVLEIRERYAEGVQVAQLAGEFRVMESTVYRILNFRTWVHVGGPAKAGCKPRFVNFKRIDGKIAEEIRERLKTGLISQKALAEEFGVNISALNKVALGKTWKAP